MAKRIVVKKEKHKCVGGPFSGTLLYLSTQSTFWFKCGWMWHGRYVSSGDGTCHWVDR